MPNHRRRALVFAAGGLVGVWLLAGAGFVISNRFKVTAEKVVRQLRATDLARLREIDRAGSLKNLARQINALPYEERRQVRLSGEWDRLFAAMSESEKGEFIEATMPTGFKQMLVAFEQLPEDKRRRAISDALRGLKKSRDDIAAEVPPDNPMQLSTNRPPPLSEELQQKVVKIGLKTFYSESSAQSKAELAPLLEEMQRGMENGALFRGPRRE
jgi:hypothetical protein